LKPEDLAGAQDHKRCRYPNLLFNQEAVQVINARYRPPGISHKHIAWVHASSLRGAVRLHREHQNPARDWQGMATHQMAQERHVLSGDADLATLDTAIFDEPPSHKRGRIDADGKADPLGWENHR